MPTTCRELLLVRSLLVFFWLQHLKRGGRDCARRSDVEMNRNVGTSVGTARDKRLRAVAERMGCEVAKVYKNHGISGGVPRQSRARRGVEMVAQPECCSRNNAPATFPSGAILPVHKKQLFNGCYGARGGSR